MPVEVDRIASRLDRARQEQVGGWTFWIGTIDGYPVVVSKTLKGVANAAAATAIAVERFHPAAIINQGTAGGHDSDLHVGDIVVGRYSVSLAAFKTPERARGTGSDTMQWQPLDLNASEGSASQDPDARTIRRFPANDRLLAAAGRVRQHYQRGKVVDGVIGSSDVWNSELDRIQWFHEAFGTSVEEMETAPAAQVAGFYGIPFLGIRVLSNNITNGGAYDPHTAEACQEFVYEVARAYIDAELKPGATARSRP
jgi:adenosylhomocysteine nucleosidase